MKSGTTERLKFKQLMRRLHLSLWQARGLLDTLWEFARNNAPRGDVGRYCNEEIAIGIDWQDDHDKLVAALVETHWLDPLDGADRLYVHDWHDHAEDSVHRRLARSGDKFANGSLPSFARLNDSEWRKARQAWHEKHGLDIDEMLSKQKSTAFNGDLTAFNPKKCGSNAAQPEPEPVPEPLPIPLPEPEPEPEAKQKNAARSGSGQAGVFGKVSRLVLEDTGKLLGWYYAAAAERKPVIHRSEQNTILVVACAAKSLERGIDDPVKMFAWMIGKRKFDNLNDSHFDAARKRILEHARSIPPPANGIPTPTIRRAT